MLAAVLLLAAAVRLISYLQVRDGSMLYAHWAHDTDMNFYDAWARGIVAGDLLTAPRPYHPWHNDVARDVYAITAPGQPFDDAIGRRIWERWLGPYAFYQDPLYAYALAAIYATAGPRPEPIVLWQGLLGLGIVAFVFVLGTALWDRTVGLVAGVLAAVYAPLIFYETTLLRGTLQAFLALAAVTFVTLGLQRPRQSRWWILAGLSAGLSVLAHATNVLLAAVLALYPFRRIVPAGSEPDTPSRLAGLARSALFKYSAGFLLALAPLLVRNVMVGAPPWTLGPAGAYKAFNFMSGQAADADPRAAFPFSLSAPRILAATDAKLVPVIKATLATYPSVASWAKRMGVKLLVFWDGWENADNINFYYFLLHSPFVATFGLRFALVVPLSVMGLALSGRRALSPPAAVVICGLVTSLVFFTSSRVRLTAAVALIPFAAAALVETVRRIRTGRLRSLALPAAAGLIAAIVSAAPWWPHEHLVRDLDYITGNTIAQIRANQARQESDTPAAARIFDKQLSTEPDALRGIDPSGRFSTVPEWAARLARSFADLHAAAAQLHATTGAPERAEYHAQRARILSVVAAQYEARVRAVRGANAP